MAVILNTGSQDMKGAVNKLNTPLDQESDIPTQVDTRADADTVIKTMDQAKQEASQSSGVPQSPFTNTGKNSSTFRCILAQFIYRNYRYLWRYI